MTTEQEIKNSTIELACTNCSEKPVLLSVDVETREIMSINPGQTYDHSGDKVLNLHGVIEAYEMGESRKIKLQNHSKYKFKTTPPKQEKTSKDPRTNFVELLFEHHPKEKPEGFIVDLRTHKIVSMIGLGCSTDYNGFQVVNLSSIREQNSENKHANLIVKDNIGIEWEMCVRIANSDTNPITYASRWEMAPLPRTVKSVRIIPILADLHDLRESVLGTAELTGDVIAANNEIPPVSAAQLYRNQAQNAEKLESILDALKAEYGLPITASEVAEILDEGTEND